MAPHRQAAIAGLAAILGALSLGAVAEARPEPPSARAVDRSTARFLDSERTGAGGGATTSTSGGIGTPGAPDGPTGGEDLFPKSRIVSLYGAPQMTATIVGRKSVKGLRKRTRKQARAYRGLGRPVIPSIDLVAVIATSDRGRDRKFRTRQPDAVISRYLRTARKLDGRLMLDIQPARSSFKSELRHLEEWLVEPDVDVALDPEWNVGRKGRPGRTTGKVKASEVNRLSAYLNRIVKSEGLPEKALVVHQFRTNSIRGRKRVKDRSNVDVTLNFDGIGTAKAKRTGYKRLTERNRFAGFSLFYRLDRGLMRPARVANLNPSPDFVLYQ